MIFCTTCNEPWTEYCGEKDIDTPQEYCRAHSWLDPVVFSTWEEALAYLLPFFEHDYKYYGLTSIIPCKWQRTWMWEEGEAIDWDEYEDVCLEHKGPINLAEIGQTEGRENGAGN